MFYNFVCRLCPLQEWAVDRWLALGATKEKLVLGMALYGRTYRICPEELSLGLGAKTCGPANGGRYTQESGFLSYYEVTKIFPQRYNLRF